MINTIKNYFKFTTNITQSENNIAYMNDTCKAVAKHLRKLQYKQDEYEVGEFLVCREYCKVKVHGRRDIIFNVNFEYEISSVNSDSLVIKNIDKMNNLKYH